MRQIVLHYRLVLRYRLIFITLSVDITLCVRYYVMRCDTRHLCLQETMENTEFAPTIRVTTGQGKVREIQGQGKVGEFLNWSGKFEILCEGQGKVREKFIFMPSPRYRSVCAAVSHFTAKIFRAPSAHMFSHILYIYSSSCYTSASPVCCMKYPIFSLYFNEISL